MPTDSTAHRLGPHPTGHTEVRFFLELDLGRTFRFADLPFEVEHLGDTLVFEEGLVLEFTEGLPSEEGSVPVTIQTGAVDWAALVAAGHCLPGAPARLGRWVVDTPFSSRQLLISGVLESPVFGAQGEELAFSIATVPLDDKAQWPPASAAVTSETWPNHHEDDAGQVYPFVLGNVGWSPRHRITGVRALLVDKSWNQWKWLIAGHRVRARTVWYKDAAKNGVWYLATVQHMEDGLGRTIAYISPPTTPTDNAWQDPSVEHEIWVSFAPLAGATIRTVTLGGLNDNETFTIIDGTSGISYVFEFQTTGGYVATPGAITVDIRSATSGDDAAGVRDLMVQTINENSPFSASSWISTHASSDPAPAAPNALLFVVNPMPGTVNNVVITDTVATPFFGVVVGGGVGGLDGGLDEHERGGVDSTYRSGRALEGLGDLLAFMLARSSLRLDSLAVAAVRTLLDRLVPRIGVCVNEPFVPLDFVRSHILPLAPGLRLTMGPDGLRPVLLDYTSIRTRIGTVLSADALTIERTGPVTFDGNGDVVNHVIVRWAYNFKEDVYGLTTEISGDPSSGARTSYLARRSFLRYGDCAEEIETWLVQTAAGAAAVANALLAERALPAMRTSYSAERDAVVHLAPGDVVAITDSELSWDERPAFIDEIRDDGGPYVELVVRILEEEP